MRRRRPSLLKVDNIPTSSQPSQHEFEKYFERAAAAGERTCPGVFISSKLSGTFDGALRAARAVHARNIGFKASFVNTYSTGRDQAFCVWAAYDAIRAGKSLDECAKAAADAVQRTRFLFSPTNLTFLQQRGPHRRGESSSGKHHPDRARSHGARRASCGCGEGPHAEKSRSRRFSRRSSPTLRNTG